jgi:hypothetical protein
MRPESALHRKAAPRFPTAEKKLKVFPRIARFQDGQEDRENVAVKVV